MEKHIQIFNFGEAQVRVSGTLEEPWFVAKDICEVLGLRNVSQACSRIPEKHKGIILNDTLGGEQKLLTVSEPGFYRLVARSDKPQAEAFMDWVYEEVLPAIRKAGRYEVQPPPQAPPPVPAAEKYLSLPEPQGYSYLRLPQTIARFIERAGGHWHGTATDLWHQLNDFANPLDVRHRDWPCTEAQMGRDLNRCSRQLLLHGIEFTRHRKGDRRLITLRYAGRNGHAPRLDPSKALPAGTVVPQEQSDLQAAIVELVLENQALRRQLNRTQGHSPVSNAPE